MRSIVVLCLAVSVGACTQLQQATDVLDSSVYPQLRTASCVLTPTIRDVRQAQRYAASGVFLDADCEWKPGDTLEDYYERRMVPQEDSIVDNDATIE